MNDLLELMGVGLILIFVMSYSIKKPACPEKMRDWVKRVCK